jgi:ubiquinol-cytochrome c reductase cytochrome c1 subunit
MINVKTIAAALAIGLALTAAPAVAQDGEEATHAAPMIEKQAWTFGGIFGTYDRNQLQRGFQVFQNVCASCHSAHLLAFRNLHEPGGPEFSEEQVKALAATFEIADPDAEGGVRPGIAADHWPNPFPTEADARAAFGVVPPDFSVIAKARGTVQPFPWWIVNYFTAYSEGGPDYIHAFLLGFHEPPEGFELPEGKNYNEFFPGHATAMPDVLADGAVAYEDEAFPQTKDQYARDVSAFLMWVAEPWLVARKEAGLRVIVFLLLFAGLMWFVKQRLWSGVHRHNPSPDDVAASGAATIAVPPGPGAPVTAPVPRRRRASPKPAE